MKYIVAFIRFLCLVTSVLYFIDFVLDFVLYYFFGEEE